MLLLLPKEKSKYLQAFINHAISVIRIAGIIGFLWFLFYMITFYISNPDAFDNFWNDANSPHIQFFIWVLLLRFPLLFGLTQLFWIKKIKTKAVYRNSIAVLIAFLAIFHGRVIERFLIFITSLHRDYLPSDYSIYDDNLWQSTGYLLYESSLLFIPIVLVKWGISEIINRLKRTHD
ncbi:MAG: hypothetical protein AAF617_03295 [Bacteroidota bacterium]